MPQPAPALPEHTELSVPLEPALLARLERVAAGLGTTPARAAASAIERYVRAAEGGDWHSATSADDEGLWRDVAAIAQRLYLGKRLGTVERQTAERFGLKALLLRLDAQGQKVTPELLMRELRRGPGDGSEL